MEWMKSISESVQFIEAHILEDISIEDIANHVNISTFYFQKGFTMMCGYTVSEYIRNRRLALAGCEIIGTDGKIIDIALKYGYDSPDSFTKAFTRFHGCTPMAARKSGVILKSFSPLKIKIILEGGNLMDYTIQSKPAFQIIGNAKKFTYENPKAEIPLFWQEHFNTGKGKVISGKFGINIDEKMGNDSFEYIIADSYKGQEISEGLVLKTIPSFDWAVFPCRGPITETLQKINTEIFSEWLPMNKEYEFAAGYCVEMYGNPAEYPKGTFDKNYYCEIWIPVKRK